MSIVGQVIMVFYNLLDFLSKLRLLDHLESIISCLSGLGNVIPESISEHFHLWLGRISIEEVGMTACQMQTRTVRE